MKNPIINEFGDKRWYNIKGEIHREDGPAVECASGENFWLINGKKHREDGPAIEYADGLKEWWLEDIQYTEEEFNKKISEMNKKIKFFLVK